jgi:hypothetical protein
VRRAQYWPLNRARGGAGHAERKPYVRTRRGGPRLLATEHMLATKQIEVARSRCRVAGTWLLAPTLTCTQVLSSNAYAPRARRVGGHPVKRRKRQIATTATRALALTREAQVRARRCDCGLVRELRRVHPPPTRRTSRRELVHTTSIPSLARSTPWIHTSPSV